jgi:hypothetical protein
MASSQLIAAGRRWLVQWSLAIVGCNFVFFIIAPTVRYPLTWDQSLRLMQIIAPVFCAYLGSATAALFKTGSSTPTADPSIGDRTVYLWLLRGPLIIFALGSITALTAFALSNSPNAPAGSGMSVDTLSTFFSVLLSLLALTTGVLTSKLFPGADTGER